jgi:NAD(P)-dependent dehydrogenase (short-subunit alcohol dehydrogenase family)
MSTSKIALVTGANKGIGKEIARQLGGLGMTVLAAARDANRGEAAARELSGDGIDVRPLLLDVTDEESVAAAAKQIESDWGRIDVLVNNAGILTDPSGASTEDFLRTYQTNVIGVVNVTNAMLGLLREGSDSRVVNMSSELGSVALLADPTTRFSTMPFYAYNSSKAALNAVTVMFANAVRADGIKVNAVSPGYCATDMNDHQGTLTAAQGAALTVRFATLPQDGPTGEFHGQEGALPW